MVCAHFTFRDSHGQPSVAIVALLCSVSAKLLTGTHASTHYQSNAPLGVLPQATNRAVVLFNQILGEIDTYDGRHRPGWWGRATPWTPCRAPCGGRAAGCGTAAAPSRP